MRTIIIAILLSFTGLLSVSVGADRQERATEAYNVARAVIGRYHGVTDPVKLFRGDQAIERAWRNLTYYYGMENDLARDLALIRARSASSREDRTRVAKAWELALELQPANLPIGRRLTLNIQAANATAKVGNVRASERYFAAARTYAFSKDRDAKQLQLQLRLQELRALGQQMPWRRLRDNLLDMRTFSEGFSMWTLPRLDALVSEAEIRLMYEPEGEGKRTNLGDLKSKIELMMKGMGNVLSPAYVNRVRDFYYEIEDDYDL